MTVLAAHAWKNNAELIADCAKLGYLDKGWLTLDPTYGRGRFWTLWCPDYLVTSDIKTGVDFRSLPHRDAVFDAAVFDPPYKLNGTPALGDFDEAYGINEYRTWQERHALILEGIAECLRVLRPRGTFLLKCQDQVCSGKIRWQTRTFADWTERCGADLVDRFDLIGGYRPQPEGRSQKHAHGRPSTLLVFKKGAA